MAAEDTRNEERLSSTEKGLACLSLPAKSETAMTVDELAEASANGVVNLFEKVAIHRDTTIKETLPIAARRAVE